MAWVNSRQFGVLQFTHTKMAWEIALGWRHIEAVKWCLTPNWRCIGDALNGNEERIICIKRRTDNMHQKITGLWNQSLELDHVISYPLGPLISRETKDKRHNRIGINVVYCIPVKRQVTIFLTVQTKCR